MKPADLREKSTEDLRELAKALARDVFHNRLKNFTNRLDDTSAVRKSKRDYARVVTLLRERELGIRGAAEPTASAGASSGEAKPADQAASKKSSASKSEAKQP
jgi:large subunit ribosomal protein L29